MVPQEIVDALANDPRFVAEIFGLVATTSQDLRIRLCRSDYEQWRYVRSLIAVIESQLMIWGTLDGCSSKLIETDIVIRQLSKLSVVCSTPGDGQVDEI